MYELSNNTCKNEILDTFKKQIDKFDIRDLNVIGPTALFNVLTKEPTKDLLVNEEF